MKEKIEILVCLDCEDVFTTIVPCIKMKSCSCGNVNADITPYYIRSIVSYPDKVKLYTIKNGEVDEVLLSDMEEVFLSDIDKPKL